MTGSIKDQTDDCANNPTTDHDLRDIFENHNLNVNGSEAQSDDLAQNPTTDSDLRNFFANLDTYEAQNKDFTPEPATASVPRESFKDVNKPEDIELQQLQRFQQSVSDWAIPLPAKEGPANSPPSFDDHVPFDASGNIVWNGKDWEIKEDKNYMDNVIRRCNEIDKTEGRLRELNATMKQPAASPEKRALQLEQAKMLKKMAELQRENHRLHNRVYNVFEQSSRLLVGQLQLQQQKADYLDGVQEYRELRFLFPETIVAWKRFKNVWYNLPDDRRSLIPSPHELIRDLDVNIRRVEVAHHVRLEKLLKKVLKLASENASTLTNGAEENWNESQTSSDESSEGVWEAI